MSFGELAYFDQMLVGVYWRRTKVRAKVMAILTRFGHNLRQGYDDNPRFITLGKTISLSGTLSYNFGFPSVYTSKTRVQTVFDNV